MFDRTLHTPFLSSIQPGAQQLLSHNVHLRTLAPHTHFFLFTGSLFLANLFLIHYWDLFFLPWVSGWREGKGSFEFLMLHMKNVALVISQQYELVNFFCRTQHSKSWGWSETMGEWRRRGAEGRILLVSAALQSDSQHTRNDLNAKGCLWMILQRLSFWEFVIHQENLLELTYPPHKHPPPPSHRSHRASLTGLQTADGSRSALWNGKISCQDRKSCTSAPDDYIWRAFQHSCAGRLEQVLGGCM